MKDVMTKRFIFLDIDGVLNTTLNSHLLAKSACSEAELKGVHTDSSEIQALVRDKYGMLFALDAVLWLRFIINMTEADIVISSTWRYSGLQTMLNLWEDRKLPGKVVGITECDYRVNTGYEDTLYENYRGAEIELYLKKHPCDSYCILDDNVDMLPHQLPHFVKCDASTGITSQVAEQAVKILINNGASDD